MSAFSTIASDARPQYAGSSCVENCSMSGKKPSAVPAARAREKSWRPPGEEKAMAGWLRGRRKTVRWR